MRIKQRLTRSKAILQPSMVANGFPAIPCKGNLHASDQSTSLPFRDSQKEIAASRVLARP